MSANIRRDEGFTTPLRCLCALVAVATLLGKSPWQQPDPVSMATAYAGAALWGVLAVFGYKPGWRRHVTWALATIYLVLMAGNLFGLTP